MANTGAVTLDVDAIGAKKVFKNFNVELVADDIKLGQKVIVVFDSDGDGGAGAWQMVSPANISGSAALADNSVTTAKIADGAVTAVKLSAPLHIVGEIKEYAGIALPSLFLWADGAAISRTTFSELFNALTIQQAGTRTTSSAVITSLTDTANMRAGMPVSGSGIPAATTILTVDSGTQITLSRNATISGTDTVVVAPHGIGNGSTTFNVPDHRGRVGAGRDDMGGTSSNRLTDQSGGVDGDVLGRAGGGETQTLTIAEMPAHRFFTFANVNAAESSSSNLNSTTQVAFSANAGAFFQGYAMQRTTSAADVGRTNSVGSDTPHNNVQPTLIVNHIIFANQ